MTLLRVRLYAVLATFAATAMLLVLHAVAPPPAAAAPCCQSCEDIGDAGYMCSYQAHDETCTGEETCVLELNQQATNCWQNCVWCHNVCYDCFLAKYDIYTPYGHRMVCYERTAGTCSCTDPADPYCR
jgi:hypothetical protein